MAPFAMFLDSRDEGPDAVDNSAEIDAHDPIPIVICAFIHRREKIDAGVVADYVNFAEDPLYLVRRAIERLAIGHVQPDRMRAPARLVKISHRAIEMILPDVGDNYFHAGVMKHFGHTETDAAPAAGDEGYFSMYIFHKQSGGNYSIGRPQSSPVCAGSIGHPQSPSISFFSGAGKK